MTVFVCCKGFGMRAASTSNSYSLLETLYNEGKINKKQFSLVLGTQTQNQQTINDESDSLLIIGDINDNYYKNDIIYTNVLKPTYYGLWWIQLFGILALPNKNNPYIQYNATWIDTCQNENPCLALVDSGDRVCYVFFFAKIALKKKQNLLFFF